MYSCHLDNDIGQGARRYFRWQIANTSSTDVGVVESRDRDIVVYCSQTREGHFQGQVGLRGGSQAVEGQCPGDSDRERLVVWDERWKLLCC